MKFKRLMDIFTGKKAAFTENVNNAGLNVLDRVGRLIGWETKKFFHQSVICAMADADECFLENDNEGNIFYENIMLMNVSASEKFIKWLSAYHTLMFVNESQDEQFNTDLEESLFHIFEFNSDDKMLYGGFKGILSQNEPDFARRFSSAAIKDIFCINKEDLDISFVYNFYKNCYTDFCKMFNKYMTTSLNVSV